MNKVLEKFELEQLQKLKSNYENIISSLGQLDVQKYSIEKRLHEINVEKQQHYSTLEILQQQEDELGISLNEKYGNGNIDMITGEITPL